MSDTTAPRYNVRSGLPSDFMEFLTRVRFSEVKGKQDEPVYMKIGDQEIITYHSTQVNDLLARLRSLGWSIRALANGFGNAYTRSIELRLASAEEEPLTKYDEIEWTDDLPVPDSTDDSDGRPAPIHEIPADVAKQMRMLQPIAQQNRRGFSDDSAPRIAAKELARMMHEQRGSGATIQQIAEAMGVKYITARLRMQRYNLLDDVEDFPSYEEKFVEDMSNG